MRLWRNYGLGIVFVVSFLIAWILMTWTGWVNFVADQHEHHESAQLFGSSGYIWDWGVQTFSNWQSDLLGAGLTVILGAYLLYRGGAHSRESTDRMRHLVQRIEQGLQVSDGSDGSQERVEPDSFFRRYALGIVLIAGFLVTWVIMTWMGWNQFSALQQEHHQSAELFGSSGYIWNWATTTLENWQSDLFGQGILIILAAYLIYRGSTESKDSDEQIEQALERIVQHLDQPQGGKARQTTGLAVERVSRPTGNRSPRR